MTTCECGDSIADGASFCGGCGRARPVDAAPTAATAVPPPPPLPPPPPSPAAGPAPAGQVVDPATGQVSTPWPGAARRRGPPTPVDPVTATLPAAPTGPPAPTPTPIPTGAPLAPPPPPPRRSGGGDRSAAYVLGGIVGLLLIVVLVLSLIVVSGDGDGDGEEATGGTAPDVTTASSQPVSSLPSSAPPSSGPTTPETVPPTSPSTEDEVTVPPTSPSTEDEPPPTTPVATAEEMASTVDGYIAALDSGDIDLAYSYIAPSLRAQEGWDYASFAEFWQGRVTGASVVSIDSTAPGNGTVTATVDYFLPDGATSRESIRVEVEPVGEDGFLALVDYEVLDSTRID